MVDNFYEQYPDFDIDFYKNFYKDLINFDDNKIKEHYIDYGINENRIISKKNFYNRFHDFDLFYYKFFNINLCHLLEYDLYGHYLVEGDCVNFNYRKYDFTVDNYHTSIQNVDHYHTRIYRQNEFREISNYQDLLNYNNQFKKHFYIYKKNCFYELYKDFDYQFYKNKYFKNDNRSEFEILLYYHTEGKYQKHLINDKYKIIIYTPPFNIKCGGIVVLHYLAKIINDMNHPKFYAKLFMYNNLKYENIFCNDFASIDEINDNTIVIYPEIVSGNPLNCKNVIRWILLDLGIEMPIDHFRNWHINDLVYFWESKREQNNIYKQLCCPWINSIFKNNNLHRDKTCYLIKKGIIIHKNLDFCHPGDSICIDDKNLEEINYIFNTSIYFYCYDPNTAYSIYAAICGCIPIIQPIENTSEDEYFQNRIYNFNGNIYKKGIVYGFRRDITYAKDVINECEEYYHKFFLLYYNTLNNFIDELLNLYDKNICILNTCKNIFY